MIVRELQTLLSYRTDNRGADRYEAKFSQLRSMAVAAAAAIAAAFSFEAIRQSVDGYTTSMNRLGASTQSVAEAAEAYELLYTSARQTGIAVEESTKGFMRFSPAMRAAGFTMHDTVALLDGLQKGLLAAGAGTAETASVFTQLGQAVNSGVFQGEELNAFLENASPTLVEAFANALGIARSELKKLASEGKLTNVNVLPALIAAAKAGRDEFGRMRPTIELSMARARIAVDRFVAEFANLLRVGETIADVIGDIGDAFDRLRSYLPIIREYADQFGGLERIFRSVATGIAAIGLVLRGSVLIKWLGMAAAVAARFAWQLGLVLLVGELIQDFITWLSGVDTQTMFGQLFGPAAPIIETVKQALTDAWATMRGWGEWIGSTFNSVMDYFVGKLERGREQFEWIAWFLNGTFTAAFVGAGAILRGFGEEFGRMWDRLVAKAQWAWSFLEPIVNGLKGLLGGSGPLTPGEVPRRRMGGLNSGALLGGFPSVPPEALTRDGAGRPVTQNNNANVNVTINAPGSDPASISGAAREGINQGFDDSWARNLNMAIPGVGQ